MPKKIINSFTQLSELNRRELFRPKSKKDRELKLIPLDPRYAISIARQLADGFNGDLRKKPSKRQYMKARRVIDTFYKNAKTKNTQLIRPRKSNRKLYAQFSDVPSNFKVYPIPLSAKDNKVKIVKTKKGVYIKEKSKFVTYRNFYFDDQKALASDPAKETAKILRKIEKIKKTKEIKIIVGRYTTHAVFDEPEMVIEEIERYSEMYKNFESFTRGLQVSTFQKQNKKKK